MYNKRLLISCTGNNCVNTNFYLAYRQLIGQKMDNFTTRGEGISENYIPKPTRFSNCYSRRQRSCCGCHVFISHVSS